MYGQNAGSEYIASSVTLDNAQDAVKKRIGVSVVRDGKTGDMIVKLVNLLPVAVNAQVELLSLEGMNTTAVKRFWQENRQTNRFVLYPVQWR